MPLIDCGQGRFELPFLFLVLYGRNDEVFPIRGNLEGRIFLDVKNFQNRFFDHQGQTVSMKRQVFDHRLSPPLGYLLYIQCTT